VQLLPWPSVKFEFESKSDSRSRTPFIVFRRHVTWNNFSLFILASIFITYVAHWAIDHSFVNLELASGILIPDGTNADAQLVLGKSFLNSLIPKTLFGFSEIRKQHTWAQSTAVAAWQGCATVTYAHRYKIWIQIQIRLPELHSLDLIWLVCNGVIRRGYRLVGFLPMVSGNDHSFVNLELGGSWFLTVPMLPNWCLW
jgi:hypothetical protein